MQVRGFDPSAVVLDVVLPDADGFALLEKLRASGVDAPVIFLTALGTQDRVHGLTIGGDDYVVKPFDLEELVARLRVVMRRGVAGTTRQVSVVQVSDLVLNETTREVRRGDRLIELTPTEFELLGFLMRNSPAVLSKAEILDHMWRYDFGGNANVVDDSEDNEKDQFFITEVGSSPMFFSPTNPHSITTAQGRWRTGPWKTGRGSFMTFTYIRSTSCCWNITGVGSGSGAASH